MAGRRAPPGTYSLFTLPSYFYIPLPGRGFSALRAGGTSLSRLATPEASPAPDPGSLSARAESNQRHAQGKGDFDFPLPLRIPPLKTTKKGARPLFGFSPGLGWVSKAAPSFGGFLVCTKVQVPASLLASGLCRWGRFCFSFSLWPVQKGGLHTSDLAFDGACWKFSASIVLAYALRAFGADAVRWLGCGVLVRSCC